MRESVVRFQRAINFKSFLNCKADVETTTLPYNSFPATFYFPIHSSPQVETSACLQKPVCVYFRIESGRVEKQDGISFSFLLVLEAQIFDCPRQPSFAGQEQILWPTVHQRLSSVDRERTLLPTVDLQLSWLALEAKAFAPTRLMNID